MANSLQQVYKIGGILAFVAIIWLLSDFILTLWMNYIGLPILGKIESTCINDLCVLTIMSMTLWFLWNNKNQEEKHFLFTNIGLCLMFSGIILYFYPRFTNTASFTLFYNFPILAYADVFPLSIILSLFFNKKWREDQKDENDKKDDLIKAVIKSYLEDKTNYAIMIANVWGAGKTYCWKNVLAPMILKEGRYKPIYVTTFGIQSVEELHAKIIEEIHPIFKGHLTKMFMALCNCILRLFGANLNSRETNSIMRYMNVDWNNYVICIDDFERIAKEGSIVGLMGYLNELIEHYHTKMIFIANEEEIKTEKHQEYKEYKEKLIRYTHLYSPNMKEVILEYANDKIPKKSEFAFYLEEKVDYIISICEKANSLNLRTLFFFLEVFEKLFVFIKQQKNENEKQVIDYFLFLSFMYAIEYKRNNIHLLKAIDTKLIKEAIYQKWLNSISENISVKREYTEVQQKQIELIELYYGLGLIEIYESKACLEFVSNGYFSEYDFKTEIENYLNSIKKGQISYEEDLLNRLKGLWDIEDEEMNSNIEESLSHIEKGTISLKLYPSFWVALMRIKDNHFAAIDKDISELLLVFKKGIEISRKTAQHIPNMENYYTMEDYDYGDNKAYKVIKDLVLKYNNDIYIVQKQEELKAKVKEFAFEVFEELCSLEIPIESIITSQEFFDEIKKATNKKKGNYINFLKERNIALLSKYDKSFLVNLKSILVNYLEINLKDCVSRKYMVLLLKAINEQLEKIEEY